MLRKTTVKPKSNNNIIGKCKKLIDDEVPLAVSKIATMKNPKQKSPDGRKSRTPIVNPETEHKNYA